MNLILAIIQPSKLEEVKEALVKIGIQGMTVTGAKGFGRQKGRPLPFMDLFDIEGKPLTVDFLPKIRIEMVVTDEMTDTIVNTIVKAAHTGKIGDGKVFVLPVAKAVRIRTGELDEAALTRPEAETMSYPFPH
jgi:nitrogen regulatory protein PII